MYVAFAPLSRREFFVQIGYWNFKFSIAIFSLRKNQAREREREEIKMATPLSQKSPANQKFLSSLSRFHCMLEGSDEKCEKDHFST